MRRVMLDEIRHLKPSLRLALLEGRAQYRDQEAPVTIDDQTRKLMQSGQLQARGGRSYAANDPRLLLHDMIVRVPNFSPQQ